VENTYIQVPAQWQRDWLKQGRRALGRVGLAAAVTFIVGQGCGVLVMLWLRSFAPASLSNDWVLLGASTLPLYLVGMPLGLLVMARMPQASPVRVQELDLTGIVTFALATYTFFFVFQMVTTFWVGLLGSFVGHDLVNPMKEFDNLSPLPSFLVIGVLAPLMEELYFRGAVLRRLLPYGHTFAIVTSALIFGMFHGNFFQMLYAFGVGLVFAYITIRTGSPVYSILMHIFFNSFNAVLLPILYARSQQMMVPATLAIMAAAVAGGALLVVQRRQIASVLRPAPVPAAVSLSRCWKAPGLIIYCLICIGMAVFSMLTMQ